MLQGILNLKIPSPPAGCPAPREILTFIAPEDIPRPKSTLILRGRERADGADRLLLVERRSSPTPGEWVAVRREDGIRVERYGGEVDGALLGSIIAALPPGKGLRYVRNLHRFPARRAAR